MKRLALLLLAVLALPAAAQQPSRAEVARWERQARNVTITRDDWGIAHVRGKSDADAVFGMIYSQAEDDFNRVETNYLVSLGRLAEAEGEAAIYRDLRARLFIDPDTLRSLYAGSPRWLKSLMDAWADGLNYYLYRHPEVKPRVITRFEPWMALSFTEGSIGGDIERVSLAELEAFYGGRPVALSSAPEPDPGSRPTGSNGIAIAPSNTASGNALLLINPHTSFFFRAELQVTSEQGLNAYGAATWGQFFIYQGFNERTGWMHTSSAVDAIDRYRETIVRRGERIFYRYGEGERPVTAARVRIPYRTPGGMATREFTVYKTHHGPVVAEADGKWISVRLMNQPVQQLMQSYLRTKTRNEREFRKVMELHANSSNNTIFADAEGNIAYYHVNFIPRRDPRFDWSQPVDGSDPATEWGAPLPMEETPHVVNPEVGWVYNSNDWPWMAAGPDSPRRESFPAYVDRGGPSPRARHAVRVLQGRSDFTLESLLAAAYDSYLVAFDDLLPPLFHAYEVLPGTDPLRAKLAEQIDSLRAWDRRSSVTSVPTSLAVYFGMALGRRAPFDQTPLSSTPPATPEQLLRALETGSDRLTADFGTWKTPWGEINRFQRLSGDIQHRFDDAAPSIPVGFTSGRWGSLATFETVWDDATKRRYGVAGNSFVAVVEFGERVRARAISAGGQSGDPASPHFTDQAQRYSTGNLREVYFYPSQLEGHTRRTYRPGQ